MKRYFFALLLLVSFISNAQTSSDVKTQIDNDITNKTGILSITKANVGNNMKAIVDYIDRKINYTTSAFRVEQNGINAPVITQYTNSLGDITWVREGVGRIVGTLSSGSFITAKTFISMGRHAVYTSQTPDIKNIFVRAGGNEIVITQDDGTVAIDGIDIKFEIRIYN